MITDSISGVNKLYSGLMQPIAKFGIFKAVTLEFFVKAIMIF